MLKHIGSTGRTRKLNYELNVAISSEPKPIVVFLHGFKAFRDWGFYPYLCERIVSEGIHAVRFDFSRSAVVEPNSLTYDADLFATNTTSIELDDAKEFLTSLLDGLILPSELKFDGRIFLVGHSKGGAIALLVSKYFPEVQKISVMGTISSFDRYSERQKELWLKRGRFEFTLNTTKQRLYLNDTYLLDIIEHKDELSITNAVAQATSPLQIIHGKQDVTVPMKEAYELAYHYPDKSKLRVDVIDRAGHGFGAAHPFNEANDVLKQTIDTLLEFLKD